jgi:hypothetical protein
VKKAQISQDSQRRGLYGSGIDLGGDGRLLTCAPFDRLSALRNHEIPGFRIGRDWRFSQDSIDRWVVEAEKVETPAAIAPAVKNAARKSFEMKRVK